MTEQTSAVGGRSTAAAAKGPQWLRVFRIGLMVAAAVFAVLMVIGRVALHGKLPACDGSTVKDTLSNLNKGQQFNASRYNFIRERSRTEDEVLCTASLELRAGGSVEYDFRIYKEESGVMVAITDIRR